MRHLSSWVEGWNHCPQSASLPVLAEMPCADRVADAAAAADPAGTDRRIEVTEEGVDMTGAEARGGKFDDGHEAAAFL